MFLSVLGSAILPIQALLAPVAQLAPAPAPVAQCCTAHAGELTGIVREGPWIDPVRVEGGVRRGE